MPGLFDAFGRLLGGALALLFPINWEEPFGVVMIKLLACGTPVIGYPHGSVPEIIEDGTNRFIVKTLESAVEAVRKVRNIDRRCCREEFERLKAALASSGWA